MPRHEAAAADPAAVLADGDVPGVREERSPAVHACTAFGARVRSLVSIWPTLLDEDLLERGIGDLEMADLDSRGSAPPAEPSPDRGPARPPLPRSPGRARVDAHAVQRLQPGDLGIALDGQSHHLAPGRAAHVADGPADHHAPAIEDAIDSHSSSTVSIWWVEKTSVLPRSCISRKASLRRATFTGSRPVNGSSMSSTCGSWRMAAMNWIFCWLPFESCSARRSAYSGIRKRSSHSRASRSAALALHAVELGEEDQLLQDAHLGVQPALLGQIAPRLARQLRVEACRSRRSSPSPAGGCRARCAWPSSCRRRWRRASRRPRPARSASEMSSRAWTSPKRLDTESITETWTPSTQIDPRSSRGNLPKNRPEFARRGSAPV